ncbi:MAG: hypothetical protein WCS94_02635 [Verrucomicrobiota bacterium]
MTSKLIHCFVWGVLCTCALALPFGMAAYAGTLVWLGHNRSWWELSSWELISGTLMCSGYILVVKWYFTLPLTAAITWCLYLRKILKGQIKP